MEKVLLLLFLNLVSTEEVQVLQSHDLSYMNTCKNINSEGLSHFSAFGHSD